MNLKTTKVYVPTHEILKDGWVNLGQDKREYVKIKEGYFFTKEELEEFKKQIAGDAFEIGRVQRNAQINNTNDNYNKEHLKYDVNADITKQDYINQILKQ